MKKPEWQLLVQRDQQGEVSAVKCGWQGNIPDSWELTDNFVWEGAIVPNGYSRGRSAITYHFNTNRFVSPLEMMAKDTCLMLEALVGCSHYADEWGIHGKWTFVKRGTEVGVTPVV